LCPHPEVERLAVASFRIHATRYDLLVLTRPAALQPVFDAVQAHLRSRNPKVTQAHVVSGPNLLTGICFFYFR